MGCFSTFELINILLRLWPMRSWQAKERGRRRQQQHQRRACCCRRDCDILLWFNNPLDGIIASFSFLYPFLHFVLDYFVSNTHLDSQPGPEQSKSCLHEVWHRGSMTREVSVHHPLRYRYTRHTTSTNFETPSQKRTCLYPLASHSETYFPIHRPVYSYREKSLSPNRISLPPTGEPEN